MSAFGIGVPELIVVFVLALIVFGPGKLPEIGAQLGRAVREFRRTTSQVTSEFTREMSASGSARNDGDKDSREVRKGEGDENGAT